MKINSSVEIAGESVVLVPYLHHHVDKYHRWMSNSELQELTASDPLSLEEEYRMQQSWRSDKDKCSFIVLDGQCERRCRNREDEIKSMIGDTNIFLVDSEDASKGEIEIMIAERGHRRKGRGREATLLMLRYGVEQLNIKNYEAKIGYTNDPSVNMFKKFGFTETSRSDVFKEMTLSVSVTNEWIIWLKESTPSYHLSSYKNSE